MTKTKKRAPRSRERGPQKAPKKEGRVISIRVSPLVHERLSERAGWAGQRVTPWVTARVEELVSDIEVSEESDQ